MLRQQRAALCTSTDSVITSTANQQPPSTANVSQSESSRLLSQYREAELQVYFQTKQEWIIISCNSNIFPYDSNRLLSLHSKFAVGD